MNISKINSRNGSHMGELCESKCHKTKLCEPKCRKVTLSKCRKVTLCEPTSIIHTILLMGISILIISTLFSCTQTESPLETAEAFIPTAANQFAIDKETETSTVEPTKAQHKYPEDFILKPEKEITIGEKQFLTKINYIKNHIDEFSNSTINVEGMYGWYTSWDETFKFPMLYRNGPGCCGDDQYGGFFLVNIDQNAFEIDDWIIATGKPFLYEHTDSEGEVFKFPFLLVETIKKLPTKERKAEMVNN